MRIFISAFCLLLIVGCSDKPGPVPRGYSSYNEPYKSAPGPKAPEIGYGFTNEKNKSVLQDMRYAARDLAERLDSHLSFDTDEIYLSAPSNNAFYKSFDHLLRQELVHRGYMFANVPENVTIIDLSVEDTVPECHLEDATAQSGPYKTVFMQLALNTEKGKPAETINGFYEVPTYGFKKDNAVKAIMPDCTIEEAVDKIVPPETVEATNLTPPE